MKKILVCTLLLLLGCSSHANRIDLGMSVHSLNFAGAQRSYSLFVPARVGRAAALLIVLHGGRGNGDGVADLTQFNQIARREGFVVAYPNALDGNWTDGRAEVARPGESDVGFVRVLIDDVSRRAAIDPRAVFVAGISNGGMMAQRLGCELSDRVAAIASVAAHMPQQLADTCRPARMIGVMLIPGTRDPIMPYQGGEITRGEGGRVLSADASAALWANLLRCAPRPAVIALPDRSADGTRVLHERYACGARGAALERYVIEGGGHTWPGGKQYLPRTVIGQTSREIDASETIWRFFASAMYR
jgi:polyhydroxybutyrate depolymerase